jgi:hypothetical protein
MGDGTSRQLDPLVNEVAWLLMDTWMVAEGSPVTASYVATFVDMAQAVVNAYELESK